MDFSQQALDLRRTIIKMNYVSGSGHLTSAYSCLEIMTYLYFSGLLKYNVSNPLWDGRDYFILSKGHAAMGLYTVLSKVGFFPESELWTFCGVGTRLGGHPNTKIPGVETCSGSLGHGLSIAVGVALGLKLSCKSNKVYCITGDGELQEGSNWEAALSINQFNLNNLVWIIDKNELQLSGKTQAIMSLNNLSGQLSAIGFHVREIDGHNFTEIADSLKRIDEKPVVIIANTVKGYGIPSIAGREGWHGRKPNKDELAVILNELGMKHEDLEIEKNI